MGMGTGKGGHPVARSEMWIGIGATPAAGAAGAAGAAVVNVDNAADFAVVTVTAVSAGAAGNAGSDSDRLVAPVDTAFAFAFEA